MDFPKSTPNIGLVSGRFADENVGTGQPGSLIPAHWGNLVTLEILNVLAAANIAADEFKFDQLSEAISKIVGAGVTWENLKNKPTTLSGFGITDGTPSALVSSDYNLLGKTAFYNLGGGANENSPPGFSGGGAINHVVLDYGFTLAYNLSSDNVAFRRKTPSEFGVWRSMWHTGNFNPTLKADLLSPVFTGIPGAPTAPAGTNNTQLANCAFTWAAINTYATTVTVALAGKADKATSLAGYGIPPATTAEVNAGADNSKPITAASLVGFDFWAGQPLGVPIPLLNNLSGVSIPPNNKWYRYITLTASDPYNSGALSGESVSGSAPLVLATAVINYPGSPMNGQVISLINTEQRVLRGSSSPGQLLQDALQNITGTLGSVSQNGAATGAFSFARVGSAATYDGANNVGNVTLNASGSARADVETRAKSIGVVYFMRIK